MAQVAAQRIRVGHSPDADDAFMFYGIATGRVDTAGLAIEQILDDIESLNRSALAGELEVSAVSFHAYPHLAERYALMPCGASMGDGRGPCVVARAPLNPSELAASTIAVPGTLTSAFLALQLFLGKRFEHEILPFDHILEAVTAGSVDAGLIIHEQQLTYAAAGLQLVVDLGAWWAEHSGGLPLPLGANVVRRDLGPALARRLTGVLKSSIEYGLDHREEALDYALSFARGLDRSSTDRFVGMYVNAFTLDCGERGRRAIERFLGEGAAAGWVPPVRQLEFVL